MNVEGVVDDKVSIPHHREVNRQVTDVAALVVILRQTETQNVVCEKFIIDLMQIVCYIVSFA